MSEKPQVELIGRDGNAYAIMGKVVMKLKEEGYSEEEISKYKEQAMSGDYDNLLRVTMEWVEVV